MSMGLPAHLKLGMCLSNFLIQGQSSPLIGTVAHQGNLSLGVSKSFNLLFFLQLKKQSLKLKPSLILEHIFFGGKKILIDFQNILFSSLCSKNSAGY